MHLFCRRVLSPSSSVGGHPAHRIRHRHRCRRHRRRRRRHRRRRRRHRRRRRRGRRHRLRRLLPPPPRDLFDCCVHVHRRLLMLSPLLLAPVA